MTEIEKAIQEFEDNAFRATKCSEISAEAKALALAALREKAENDKLREAGRLVVLPDIKRYKTLYWLWGDEIMPVKYMGIRGGCVDKGKFHITCNMNTQRDRTFIHNKKSFTYKAGDHRMFYLDDIGKTVFLTREEAENVLEG